MREDRRRKKERGKEGRDVGGSSKDRLERMDQKREKNTKRVPKNKSRLSGKRASFME